MNDHEIQRIAAAMHAARPDWPASSVATLIRTKLADRPRRDVFVALAWIASEPNSATPARVLEAGPWWKAAATEQTPGSSRVPWEELCHVCSQSEHGCRAMDAKTAPEDRHKYLANGSVEAQRLRAQAKPAPETIRRLLAKETL